MRNAFAAEVTALAGDDERVVLLMGDIGNRLFNDFKDRHPERFFNCGVAEANMTGMAAGMASCGLRPFTYTITPFATTRCLEQIRVDVCYHHLPVTIIGTGAGLSYGIGRLGNALGPLIVAFLFTTYGYRSVFAYIAACWVVVAFLILTFGPRMNKRTLA